MSENYNAAGALAIIPARGGSKRIPRKNIKDFYGKPIIAYTIETALATDLFSAVMVSTEDEDIAMVASSYGADVPFLRSAETATDTASTADVLLEVLSRYKEGGQTFSNFCCIYPTSVLITAEHIKGAFQLLDGHASVLPALRYSHPVQRGFKSVSGRLSVLHPEYIAMRTQDLEPIYHDAGQFYWLNTEKFLTNRAIFTDDTMVYELDEMHAQDIDNMADWHMAELKYKFLSEHMGDDV